MAALFPSFESKTVTIDGVKLHYFCGGTGSPLVLVHGLGSRAEDWANLMPQLKQAGFHVYAIEWEPDAIRWYVDDTLYQSIAPKDLPGRWVSDHPFFIILNVAVGGYWPGAPDSTTVFPQTMRVDYVRVYGKTGAGR